MKTLALLNCEENILEMYISMDSVITFRSFLLDKKGYIKYVPKWKIVQKFLDNKCSINEMINSSGNRKTIFLNEKTVYFKEVTPLRKAIVLCAEEPTAAAVQAAKQGYKKPHINTENAGTISFKFDGPHNFGTQYLLKMDCTKLSKSDEPKVGTEFTILTTNKPVIKGYHHQIIKNMYWAEPPGGTDNPLFAGDLVTFGEKKLNQIPESIHCQENLKLLKKITILSDK